jgi:hypothetical protein
MRKQYFFKNSDQGLFAWAYRLGRHKKTGDRIDSRIAI